MDKSSAYQELQMVKDELHKSVCCGDVNKTQKILQSNSEVDINSDEGPLLHLACKHGYIKMVRCLVSLGADVNLPCGHFTTYGKFTPLSEAVRHNHTNIVSALLSEFGCNPNDGVSLLAACKHQNLSMVKILLEYGASVQVKDSDGNTPFHLTAKNCWGNETMQALLKKSNVDSNIKNKWGRTPLHIACECGNLGGVKLLIEHGASVNDRVVNGNTLLHLAAKNNWGNKTMQALLRDSKIDPNIKNKQGRTPLHIACWYSNLSSVNLLIEHGASVNNKDSDGNTFLHLIAKIWGNQPMQALLKNSKFDPNIKNKEGRTPLHITCERSNLGGVKLWFQAGANVNDKDVDGNTPLHLTAKNWGNEMMNVLLEDCKSDPNIKNKEGRTPLHITCWHGNLGGVNLLIKHGADIRVKDINRKTPLSLAVLHNRMSIASALLSDFGCDSNDGVSLHVAWKYANHLRTIEYLVKHHKVSEEEVNWDGETLMMTGVRFNKCEIVRSLVSDHGWDVNVRGRGGRSLLHVAVTECGEDMLKLLINEYGMSPSIVDEEGNTPLHVRSIHGQAAHFLLHYFHAPVYIRNRRGETPRDVAKKYNVGIVSMFDEYISINQGTIINDYRSMQKLAAAKYSGSHCITRVFVVGHPGAGKSSLVEALKREGFIESFNRVSSKSVALHTAGIVPSIHTSDSYGRIQFYDFAGDPEYYSSHAAILEKLFLSDIGNNICIIVLNSEDQNAELEKKYLYWLTFINHNTKNLRNPLSVIVTGSHADLLPRQALQNKEEYLRSLLKKSYEYISLDCCNPRSTNIKLLRQKIQELSMTIEPYDLSYEGSILLGLLEKDFSNVTACTAKTIVTHISEVNLLRLPRSLLTLYPILEQLQAIGSLLILGGMEEDCYLVLNIPQLTNEVHKRLFCDEAFSNKPDMASFNIGLLPQSLLQEVLPPYITKECLTQLQYCQEISHVEIGQDYSISPSPQGNEVASLPDESLLFFPALCKLDRSNVSWQKPQEGSYSIGWLARCTNSHDYFPPRFLHILLLRVSLRFTLVAPSNPHPSQDTLPDHVPLKRRCKMWKTGVHWLTEEGVECEVDVDISKEVVVSIRSMQQSKKALTVFNSIISCVMEVKAEFCHSTQLKCFLLDKVGCLSEDNLFQIEDAERVLREHNEEIISVSGDTSMPRSKLLHIRCTFWDSLFPLDEQSVLQYIKDLVDEWFQLGEHLELPYTTLRAIESDFPNSVRRRKLEMVTTWLHSHPPFACWWSLVKALQEMGENASAAAIIRDKGEPVEMQKKLLESEYSHIKPEEEFLQSISGAVGSKWPYLAALLSLGGSEIKEVHKVGEGLSQCDYAFLMLSKWASREGATYGHLYEKLKPTTIFQLCK